MKYVQTLLQLFEQIADAIMMQHDATSWNVFRLVQTGLRVLRSLWYNNHSDVTWCNNDEIWCNNDATWCNNDATGLIPSTSNFGAYIKAAPIRRVLSWNFDVVQIASRNY